MDKLSFIGKLSLLNEATRDDETATAGYMYTEINKISYESSSASNDLLEWLMNRLLTESSTVKLKVIKISKFLVINGHPRFRQGLRKKSQGLQEATKYNGPLDALTGNTVHLMIRSEAKELLEILFASSDENIDLSMYQLSTTSYYSGMGSTAGTKLQGFGNSPFKPDDSFGSSIISGVKEVAARLVEAPKSGDTEHPIIANFSTYEAVGMPVNQVTETSEQPVILQKKPPVHRPGVAGGGWDDEESIYVKNYIADKMKDSVSDSDSSKSDLNIQDSYQTERSLVDSIVCQSDSLIPKRQHITDFIKTCSNVNCDVVVELLNKFLTQSDQTFTMRALLVLEALMRTDLVCPEHLARIFHKNLLALYQLSTDNPLQHKARKIVRILEKLAPKEKHLFSETNQDTIQRQTDCG